MNEKMSKNKIIPDLDNAKRPELIEIRNKIDNMIEIEKKREEWLNVWDKI